MSSYHLDWESFGTIDLTEVGAYRYASHKDTELMMASISRDGDGPYLWVNRKYRSILQSHPKADQMMEDMADDDEADIWAWNAPFEAAMAKYRWKRDVSLGRCPALHRFRCVAAVSRSAGLPSALEKFAELMLVEELQKDPEGKRLIKLLCEPQKNGKRRFPSEVPQEFKKLGRYCLQDNRAEVAGHDKLEPFLFKGRMLEAWKFDLMLNDRGMPLNVEGLKKALVLINEASSHLVTRFRKLTGLNPTQREKVRALVAKHGLKLPNMKKETIADVLEGEAEIGDRCRVILDLYSQIQYSAVAKVRTMLDCVCDDGWARGMLQFYGAGTGRWSGRLIQPQNMRKSTIGRTDIAYAMICEGCSLSELELVFGNGLEVIASCIRNFIHWMDGVLFDADYSAIEARIINWLAGQEDALERYRRKEDSYVVMASVIYGKAKEKITKDEREVGKRAVLGCGFSMAGPKFKKSCWEQYRIAVSQELADKAVAGYRQLHPKVQKFWYALDNAARSAITKPGTVFQVGDHIRIWVHTYKGVPYMLLKLPSGRKLAYPWPKLEQNPDRDRPEITFYGQIKGKHWGRVKTYGGKLAENATQAVAADIMANGSINATEEGFQIISLIHDQAPALALRKQKLEDYVAALTRLPEWAEGLPIKADGKVVPYYTKVI